MSAPLLGAKPKAFEIPLSVPHLSGREAEYVAEAIESNWVAPLGPMVDRFEREFAARVDAPYAVALASGTAALHLALIHLGIGPGDEVLVSSLTFAASVNPIVYLGATPVLIDSEPGSWNADPALIEQALGERAGRVKAVVAVHLYGQSADLGRIRECCERFDVPLIEDAAEALGGTWQGRQPGTVGWAGVFSFNGNKIITTGGGGMLVTGDADLADHARKLSTQARDDAPHYQHSEIGYNYRLSNLLAAVGRAQLEVLDDRVARRRAIFDRYRQGLAGVEGIELMREAPWGTHNRWLSTLTIDERAFGASREAVRLGLAERGIEGRPVWKPMHQQPVFEGVPVYGGAVADDLFDRGLCLPSGSSLTDSEVDRVIDGVLSSSCRAKRP
ncbi:MAG: aminotransferase class I/II-fold pyridoxal phosphate-dependent enzyme [Gemmatimonadales bacterium]